MKNLIKNIFLLLQSIFFTGAAFSQSSTHSVYFDHLTISEGLSHNTVFCMLQDRDGYIWVGTQNGLNKYDGYSFEVYRSGEETDDRFRGKIITALHEDSYGNLWVGTAKEGINFKKYGTDSFKKYPKFDRFPEIKGKSISSIKEDSKGNIWISTEGAGVLKWNPDFKASVLYNSENSGLSDNVVFDTGEDVNGQIWVAAGGTGLNYLDDNNRFQLTEPLSKGGLNMEGYRKKLFPDKENLWVATEGTGLYQMKNLTRKHVRYAPGIPNYSLSSNMVRDVIRTESGDVIIATDGGGLNIITGDSGNINSYYFHPDDRAGLNSNALYCLLEDRAGNIWIGTYNGGVNLIKKNKIWFEFYSSGTNNPSKLEKPSVLSVCESGSGDIWIGSDGGGLNLLKKENGNTVFQKFMHDPRYTGQTISGNVVKTVFEDSKGRLWLGCFNSGLDMFIPGENRFESFPIGDNIIWSIAETRDGKLLIGTLDAGLNLFDPETGKFRRFNPNPEADFDEREIMVVFFDRKNRLWVGTGDNGLYFFDNVNKHYTHFENTGDSNENAISNNEIRSIFQDSRGDIWIGTEGGGLNKVIEKEGTISGIHFQKITKENGLIANDIMGITEDQDGMIWISTFEGISKLNPITGEVENFNFHTGQNSNQFNQSAILTSKSGKVYFGGIKGLNAIHPNTIVEKSPEANVVFTDLKIFNKSISSGKLKDGRVVLNESIEIAEEIFLDYEDNSFSIDFMSTDFTNSRDNVFEYKMEGFDLDWQMTVDGEHSASYTNLDPGTFLFRVRHGNTEKKINVIINPPFWKTVWFRALMLMLIVSGIAAGFQFALSRKQSVSNRELLEAKAKILQLKNKNLETEVEAKNSKLMFSSVQMAHKKEILNNIKTELEVSKGDSEKIRKVIRMLDKELKGEDYWKEFNLYFEQVDKEFVKEIKKKHPKLTQNDLRMCSLIRLNLSTKEIASLLNVSVRGVEQGRYRMKKRLELTTTEDLVKYISGFK